MQKSLNEILLEVIPTKKKNTIMHPYGAWKDKFSRIYDRRSPYSRRSSYKGISNEYEIMEYILSKISDVLKTSGLYVSKTYQNKPSEFM